MRFNIVSNLMNGVGLQQDYLLLKAALEERGHAVRGVQFNTHPVVIHRADVNVFLEVVHPGLFQAAPKNWAVPNPEWWFAHKWDTLPWDLILAKTHDCERIFTGKFGAKCQYLGWTARDLFQPIARVRKFLHVAGKSRMKNTQATVTGCLHARVPLTLVGDQGYTQPPGPERVTRVRVHDDELTHLMNSHFCHVMPSGYEGYGQVLHEAQACGQVIITTNAPPMNEVKPAVLIPTSGGKAHHAAFAHRVEGGDVAIAVRQVMTMSEQQLSLYQNGARAQYHQDRVEFYRRLDTLVGKKK